jgi:hypothetical protein
MHKYWLNPPAITELNAGEGLPPWILLDTRIYFAHRNNSTTAKATTSKGQGIEVMVCVAAPPALSFVCIHARSESAAPSCFFLFFVFKYFALPSF